MMILKSPTCGEFQRKPPCHRTPGAPAQRSVRKQHFHRKKKHGWGRGGGGSVNKKIPSNSCLQHQPNSTQHTQTQLTTSGKHRLPGFFPRPQCSRQPGAATGVVCQAPTLGPPPPTLSSRKRRDRHTQIYTHTQAEAERRTYTRRHRQTDTETEKDPPTQRESSREPRGGRGQASRLKSHTTRGPS